VIQDLQYEPPDEAHPPDFRFQLHGVSFDLQVKQLHNTKNEMTKRLFERECRRHLSRLPKPWFINFWVADHFTRQHLNPFSAYLKGSLEQFSPATMHDSMLGKPQCRWEQDGRTLVQFSFTEKRRKEPGIFPGVIHVMATESGFMAPIDTGALRKGVERLLRKARPCFIRPASPTQANLLVMQAPNIWFADKLMPDALYGTEQFGVHKTTGKVECFRAPLRVRLRLCP